MSKTINQQAALLLKNMELQNVLHEHDNEIDAEYMPEAEQNAIKAVAAYKRRQDEIAYMFPLSEIVYEFLGRHKYPDEILAYKHLAVQFLAAMTDVEFNQQVQRKVGDYSKKALVCLMTRLTELMENLEASAITPLLLIQDIKSSEMSEEQLNKIKEEYEERLRVSLAGKYKFA